MKKYTNWREVFASAKPMEFNAFNTGRITGKIKTYADTTSFPENFDMNTALDCDMMAFSFEHPEKGDILIDCGFSRSFTDNPPYGNLPVIMKIFQKLNSIRYSQLSGEDFENHMKRLGIEPTHVFLTHVHPDHTSGLTSLNSNCTVYFGKKENTFYYSLIAGRHLKGKKIKLLDFDKKGCALEPFEKVLDVFEDASFFAISTPGHTKDHIAYLINNQPTPNFIVGDAELNRWAVENGIKVNTDYGKQGLKDVYKSSKAIQQFLKLYPNIHVHYSHNKEDLRTETTISG
ncbi:MBL fold metallo-hydrolase [Maribacter aestuarii]|uniref:MBL fold metallo-hydrolase n=1 Tax=Maribacter aestuarii TaxID=1130723 RepID=UPI00248BBF85|nr:MBL fold metallo-hydrolase [Maribacter aestuarii]